MREHLLDRIRPLRTALGLAGLLLAFAVATETPAAQTVARTYERLAEQERTARAAPSTPVTTLRSLATAYENMVRRYPTSGYSDNALWQAAGLRQLAFERGASEADRDHAARLLGWLQREYPHSPLVKQIDSRRAALGSARPAIAAAPPAPARPAAVPPDDPASATPPAVPLVSPQAPAASASGPTVIRSINRTTLPKGDRIIIELSREVTFSGDRVDNPDRVFFDFAGTALSTTASQAASAISGTFVKSMRLGRHASGVVRVVMEVNGQPRYSTFPLYNPFRLVIDVEGDAPIAAASGPAARPAPPPPPPPLPAAVVSSITKPPAEIMTRPAVAAPALRDAPPPAPAPAPVAPASTGRGDYSLARQLGLSVSRVVIDAGHGGHDPGAKANGVEEAELVLDVSQRLAALLRQQPGFEVVLTRNTDVFIPLEERTAIANREGADLFLSIHANAARNTSVRGIETYLLNFATNPQAEAVAARENASSAQTMGTLPSIVKAIALNSKLKESREFATHTQTALVRRLSTQNKGTRDLGVKQAPFVVLIGAEMPSVLAEIAFLTNRAEASLLKQSSYRQSIAQALCDGILRYQASLKKVTTVAGGSPESR